MAKKKGKYYYQGHPSKKIMKMICDLIDEGVTVYHQFGKPTPPPKPPGGG